MVDSEAIRIENRLTKVESGQVALREQVATTELNLSTQIQAVVQRLDQQNGSIQRHFDEDHRWQEEHGKLHAYADGEASGRSSLRKGDLASLGAVVAVVTLVLNIISRVLP